MKIAYFDLGVTSFFEDYSISPKGYGGGPCFARWAKEYWNNANNTFLIIGQKENFLNLIDNENKFACYAVDKHLLDLIRQGYPLSEIIGGLEDFDIIIHHHDCLHINAGRLKAKSIHWSLSGKPCGGHPYNDYDLLYLKDQVAKWPTQKLKFIKLGKPVPRQFEANKKEDFIFQCTRHDEHMNTNEVVQLCNQYKIKGYFAGPIHDNYDLLKYIDNQNTFYLGKISEEEKLDYTKRAFATTYLHRWDTVFNQSVIESLGVGTPIICNPRGFLKEITKEGYNGIFFNGSNFLECVDLCKNISQRNCWESAKEYSVEEMLNSFKKAFEEILNA